MAAAAILNLFESKIAPLDPPKTVVPENRRPRRPRRPRKPHPRTKHEVDWTTGCGDMAFWNFSRMAVAAILDLFEQ